MAEQAAPGAHHPTNQGALVEPDGGGLAARLLVVERVVGDIAEDSLVLETKTRRLYGLSQHLAGQDRVFALICAVAAVAGGSRVRWTQASKALWQGSRPCSPILSAAFLRPTRSQPALPKSRWERGQYRLLRAAPRVTPPGQGVLRACGPGGRLAC